MTDYNKMSKKNEFDAEELLEQIEEIEEIIPSVPEPVVTEGMVACERLYVRSEPTVDSEPLGIIKRDSVVEIIEDAGEFYNVYTETGLDGFCMKKFITVL